MSFKVGDRVRVYGHIASGGKQIVGIVIEKPVDCSEKFKGADYVLVQDEKYDQGYYCHPKQCRRLVKKERRRRIFVDRSSVESLFFDSGDRATRGAVISKRPILLSEREIEFIEVRRKK